MSIQDLQAATLPLNGWHIIEASAGTGKTYNISRIFLRLVLEKRLPVDQILVMTFTRAATQELRLRINALLREVLLEWDSSEDPVVVSMRERVAERDARILLQRALLNLDQAAIFTIHGFCQRILQQQAFNSGVSFSPTMRENSDNAVLDATRDWYRDNAYETGFLPVISQWKAPDDFFAAFRNILTSSETLDEPESVDLNKQLQDLRDNWQDERETYDGVYLKGLRKASKKEVISSFKEKVDALLVAENPQAEFEQLAEFALNNAAREDMVKIIKSKDACPSLLPLCAAILAAKDEKLRKPLMAGIAFIREAVIDEKVREDALDFDDQIEQLRASLTKDDTQTLAEKVLEQFPAALVDEFQDTDPSQFAILKAIYESKVDDAFLCLIGDPKQAIYGFRGGDIFAYIDARNNADTRWGMGTNYRSSADVIAGYNRLFNGAPLDQTPDESVFGFDIDYQVVSAGRPKPPKLSDPESSEHVQWVVCDGQRDNDKALSNAKLIPLLAECCANEVTRTLQQASLNDKPVTARDIAILVRSGTQANALLSALQSRGVNAVFLSDRSSVLKSDEASHLLQLIHGVLFNEQRSQLLATLASPWFGFDGDQIHQLRDDDLAWSKWQQVLQELRDMWEARGLMSMAMYVLHKYYQPNAQLRDQELSNILHLLEILQQASQKVRQRWALVQWFRQQIEDDDNDLATDARLHAEHDLVRIITMHGSKGLEYPIVFMPYVSLGNSPRSTRRDYHCRYHTRDDSHAARLAVLPNSEIVEYKQEEDFAESIRLLYVAATRAEVRMVTFLADSDSLTTSSLGLCLSKHQGQEGPVTFESAKKHFGAFTQENIGTTLNLDWDADRVVMEMQPSLELETYERPAFVGSIERDWWLSSFTSISRNLRHSYSVTLDRDQNDMELYPPTEELPLRYRLKKGAEAGNLLHDLLERLDFAEPNYEESLEFPKQRYTAMFDTFEDYELIGWVEDMLAAELIPGMSLGQLSSKQTLRESEFYFPMHGKNRDSMRLLAEAVSFHLQEPFELPGYRTLKGMMHGFIDLIFEWDGRYYVADYKSTWLGNHSDSYTGAALTQSMRKSVYDLQYLIYSLALHRYLKTRIADYSPEEHFGGAIYLYLRGMHKGKNTGVYYQPVTGETLDQLDAVFANDGAMR